MAGIGFELKKLYGDDRGITRTVGAMGYSVLATIGPTLMVVAALVITQVLMNHWGVDEVEKNVFAGCTLYCFVLALLISSVFDTVLSRYMSDCIFSEKEERIRPTIQGSTAMFALIYGVVGAAFALALYFISGLDAGYVLMVYLLLMGVGLTFALSIFVTALKAYRQIAAAYLVGCVALLGVGIACRYLLGMQVGRSMITGFAVGFLLIAGLLYFFLHLAFPRGDKSYTVWLKDMRTNKLLLISGLFYVMGLYVHNMVFWAGSELQVVVADIIYCAPTYDMASFLAMLTSITSVVIFVVRVETSFYPQYKGYCEAVIGNNLSTIRLNREKMTRTLINEVYYVGEFQLIITVVIMTLAITFLPLLGIAGLTVDIYPILSLGYYTVFMMHLLVIFLYYFDDQAGAAAVSVLFFVLTLSCTIFTKQLGISFYGLGLVVSGALSWIIAFLRLKYILRNVDYRMFCDNIKRNPKHAVS